MSETKIFMTVPYPLAITQTMVRDLFITAMEGAINYWATYEIDFEIKPDEPPAEQIFDKLMEGERMKIYDAETGDFLGTMNVLYMKAGLKLMRLSYGHHFNNFVGDNADAETADVWFQLSVMRDLVFG